MEPFRWVLLLIGVIIIALVFAYSRGLLSVRFRLPKGLSRIPTLQSKVEPEESVKITPQEEPVSAPKPLPRPISPEASI